MGYRKRPTENGNMTKDSFLDKAAARLIVFYKNNAGPLTILGIVAAFAGCAELTCRVTEESRTRHTQETLSKNVERCENLCMDLLQYDTAIMFKPNPPQIHCLCAGDEKATFDATKYINYVE